MQDTPATRGPSAEATICDMYLLDKETFARVLAHYPAFERHMQDVAKQRQEQDSTL